MKAIGQFNRIAKRKFTNANSAGSNHVFLLENCAGPFYLQPVNGWKIIGFGDAPWPGSSDGFAVMFERINPEDSQDRNSMPEGTQIWQHMRKHDFQRYVHHLTMR